MLLRARYPFFCQKPIATLCIICSKDVIYYISLMDFLFRVLENIYRLRDFLRELLCLVCFIGLIYNVMCDISPVLYIPCLSRLLKLKSHISISGALVFAEAAGDDKVD